MNDEEQRKIFCNYFRQIRNMHCSQYVTKIQYLFYWHTTLTKNFSTYGIKVTNEKENQLRVKQIEKCTRWSWVGDTKHNDLNDKPLTFPTFTCISLNKALLIVHSIQYISNSLTNFYILLLGTAIVQGSASFPFSHSFLGRGTIIYRLTTCLVLLSWGRAKHPDINLRTICV